MNHRRQSSLSRLKSIANRFTIRDYLLPCIVKPKILILRVYYKVLIWKCHPWKNHGHAPFF